MRSFPLVVLAACGLMELGSVPTTAPEDPAPIDATSGGVDAKGNQSPTTPTEPKEPPVSGFADDVRITRVSLYQGVERPLWDDGTAPTTDVPAIAERDGLVRVFVEPLDGFTTRELLATLTLTPLKGATTNLFATLEVQGASQDGDLDSTFVFDVDGTLLTADTELRVSLHEVTSAPRGDGTASDASFDSAVDLPNGLDLQPTDDLRIVIIPFRYMADGSNRLPDTSDAAMAAMQEQIEAMYPVRSVEIEVADAWDWNTTISRAGAGFGDALRAVSDAREDATEPANTYYYGLFDPASSFNAFCVSSCVVGLSNLATNPNFPSLRASVGIGYTERDLATDTLLHEVGHAFGRAHAPCGGPAQVDPSFPHANGGIGSWGYDRVESSLVDPNQHTDMMSYCDPTWVSDYNFTALHTRMATLSQSLRTASQWVSRLHVDASGTVTDLDWALREGGVTVGDPVTVERLDATGEPQGFAIAWFAPYSHLGGGVVLMDEALPEGWTAVLR